MNRKRLKYKINIGKILFCLLFLPVLLFPSILPAQTYPTRHYTMRDGLPGLGIQCIYKDTRGLLWIGTNAGLCSFDGKTFRIFKPSEGMTASQVWAIAEDESGNMWFGSMGDGLYKYDGRHFKRFTKKDGLADDRIRVLCWSEKFNCLVAGSYGCVSTIREDSITAYTGLLTENDNLATVTGMADAGDFIYITNYAINNPIRYYPDKNVFITVHDNDGEYYPDHSFSVYISSKGDTIFSLENKGVRIFNNKGIAQNDTLGQIFGITEDKRGDLWLASWSIANMDFKGGIYRYDGNNFTSYTSAFGITDREIWTVFYDKEQDILWIGTLNEGLFKVPFSAITNYSAKYFKLQQQKINDVYLDSKNSLWISGYRELIKMAPDGSYSFMDKHPMMLAYRQFWNDKRQLPYPQKYSKILAPSKMDAALLPDFEKQTDFNFWKVIEDNDQSIIFANEFGLFRYNEEKRETYYLGPEGAQSELAVMGDTLIDSYLENTILNTKFRENRIGVKKNWNYPPTLYVPFTKNLDPRNVTRLVKKDDRFWYTSRTDGLWMSKGMRLVHFNKSDSTISNSLNDICFDEKGHVIFGSNTGEICIATYNNEHLKIEYRINNDNGLQGSSISWLVADQKGKLWAGTNLGLNCIYLDSLYSNEKYLIRFMDEEEGYTGQSAKRAVLDKAGHLWIGAGDNLLKLNTSDFLSFQSNTGKVILKSLEVKNEPVDSSLISSFDPWTFLPLKKINFKHSENDIVIYFDVLNYNNPAKDRFRTMLKGYDKEWNQWSERRRAVYTNLPPGRYTLYIESYNLRTLLHAKPLMFEFTIRHPWWELWHLQVAGIALLLAIVVLITRKFTKAERNKQQQKSEIEKKIVELEMQALQAQMNPHFIFNCMNGIQYFVLANKMDEVLAYLSDFSKVVSQTLVSATLRMVPLEQEIDFLKSYLRLEQMRFPDKFDFEINSLKGDDAGIIFLPPMLIQPFAENAIRHGFVNLRRKGHISIEFEKTENDLLKCTITDNGIGRDKARLKTESTQKDDRSHSGTITETRIRLFNSPDSPTRYKLVYFDLLDKGKPQGLRVELYLPMETGGNAV